MATYTLDGNKMTKDELEQYADDNGRYIDWDMIAEDDDAELTEAQVINDENTQKLRYAIILAEDEQYEEARKELSLTDQYCDWNDTIADRILAQAEDEENEDYLDGMEEYNAHVAAINKYHDKDSLAAGMSRGEVISTIAANS